jgi:hypothetical protein
VIAPLLLIASLAQAEDLSKATRGLLLASDCEEEICRSYTIEVSQKFVRLPIKKQVGMVKKFCNGLDKLASEYEDWSIQSCVFRYQGQDIAYQATDGRVLVEPWYVAALAALRD